MQSWNSYPSIFNLGHRALKDLFTVPVNVEEKVDGSQFSFGKDSEGTLYMRSKGVVMNPDATEKMFTLAAETVRSLAPKLTPGWTYRGEFLQKPKHNALAYDRVPAGNIILFDVNTGLEGYLDYLDKDLEASRLGLECVPLLYTGMVENQELLKGLLDTVSVLGGQKIEGVVIKPTNYDIYAPDKKVLMGKFVSEAFKEVHRKTWGEANPSNGDFLERLAEEYKTPARWQKAVLHLHEAGRLEDSPRDIAALVKEVPADIEKECREDIQERLWKYAWPKISRQVIRGLPEWYKEQLLAKQFEEEKAA